MEPRIVVPPHDRASGEPATAMRGAASAALSAELTTVVHPAEPLRRDPAPAPSHVHANGTSHGHGPLAHANGHAHMNGHANGNGASANLNGHASTLMLGALPGGFAPAIPVFEPAAGEGFYLRFGKRVLDVLGAVMGLVLSSPTLLFAALAIKLESRGPVLYRSTRIGRGGRPFTFYKLRSMVNGADRKQHELFHLNESDGPVFKIARDPRITRVGRFLRVTSIDELPQLVNVLRGEMSLVGPRPPIPSEVAQYEPWQLRRLAATPGLTCLWQISGRSCIGFQEWMRLDLEYIRQRSFWLDVKILLRTIPAVLSREGAY
jgi:lipopolysaccharide/colanic/teichoic acid biosynthesis glycosyltransferase